MVRRAILRVAFLAEVVLAMVQISFGGDRLLAICCTGALRSLNRLTDAAGFRVSSRMRPPRSIRGRCATKPIRPRHPAPPKEQRRRDCARRHRRPYRGGACQRQRLRGVFGAFAAARGAA